MAVFDTGKPCFGVIPLTALPAERSFRSWDLGYGKRSTAPSSLHEVWKMVVAEQNSRVTAALWAPGSAFTVANSQSGVCTPSLKMQFTCRAPHDARLMWMLAVAESIERSEMVTPRRGRPWKIPAPRSLAKPRCIPPNEQLQFPSNRAEGSSLSNDGAGRGSLPECSPLRKSKGLKILFHKRRGYTQSQYIFDIVTMIQTTA
jgi:hypothetical protein